MEQPRNGGAELESQTGQPALLTFACPVVLLRLSPPHVTSVPRITIHVKEKGFLDDQTPSVFPDIRIPKDNHGDLFLLLKICLETL